MPCNVPQLIDILVDKAIFNVELEAEDYEQIANELRHEHSKIGIGNTCRRRMEQGRSGISGEREADHFSLRQKSKNSLSAAFSAHGVCQSGHFGKMDEAGNEHGGHSRMP